MALLSEQRAQAERLAASTADILSGQGELGVDLDLVSTLIGRPGGQVTQDEYDAVVAILAEDEALTTQQRLQFDINSDGLVDQGDLGPIQGQLSDQPFYSDQGTGLYGAGAANTEAIQQQAANQGLLGLIGAGNLDPLTHTTSAPAVANINYVYDPFGENIFATDQQAAFFGSPYGSGQTARQSQIAQQGAKRNNAVGFGGLAQGGEVKYDFDANIARIMSFGDD